MTQSPLLSPMFQLNTINFLQHYMDCLEALPLDVQRYLTQLREFDLLHRLKINQIGQYLREYKNGQNGSSKRKYLNKIQKCLIKSQQYGDEKINLVAQIVDMVENRTQHVNKYADEINTSSQSVSKEETTKQNGISSNQILPKIKLEKPKVVGNHEKTPKNIYEKPKRARRVRTHDKHVEKSELRTHTSSRYNTAKDHEDVDEEEEDEEMEADDEIETSKSKKENSIRKKEKDSKLKDKKEDKNDRKEEKKIEKREKTITKVTKKSSKVSAKLKKKKKKEKESVGIEEMVVDPDEPTYCICNSISYGDMIGCDNDDCEIEWFHFGCVNLTHKPKGKWYCPGCSAERKDLKTKK